MSFTIIIQFKYQFQFHIISHVENELKDILPLPLNCERFTSKESIFCWREISVIEEDYTLSTLKWNRKNKKTFVWCYVPKIVPQSILKYTHFDCDEYQK